MSYSISTKPSITITNTLYLTFCTKNGNWFALGLSNQFLACTPFPCYNTASQEFIDTHVFYWQSQRFLCSTVMRKILETSHGKMSKQLYIN